MSTTATPTPAATAVPAAKDAPPAPIPSVADKVAAAFKTEPPPPMPKMPTAPAKPATEPAKTEPAAKTEPVKPAPTLLPKKTPVAPKTDAPDADPDAKFTLPDTASDEQKSQWTQLKQTARERYNRIKELESKVNAPAVVSAEVERLRAEHKAATDRLAVLDLQSHPDFKRQYSEPKSKALAEVNEILAFAGKEGADLPSLLSLDRKNFSAKVTELTKDLNPMDATSVQSALRSAYLLSGEEKAALSKAGELSTKLAQQSEAQARQAFEEVSSNLGPMGDFLVTLDVPEGATPEERAEIDDYNQSVANVRQNVEQTVFGKTNEKSMAVLGWKGATLDFLLSKGIPRMEKVFAQLSQSHAALAAELAAIKGAKGSGVVAGDPSKGGTGAKTNEQLVAEAFGKK